MKGRESPRRVLLLITRMDQRGGAQMHVLHLALGVREMGWEVTVMAGATGPLLRQIEEAGIACRILPGLCRGFSLSGDWRALRTLRSFIRDWRPDVISAHTSKAAFLGRLAGWREKVPVSATPHGLRIGPGISFPIRLAVYLTEWVVSRLGRQEMVMVSGAEASLARRSRCIPASQLRVIPIGIPDAAANETVLRDGPVVRVAMVARFQAPKDHATLFRSLSLLPRNLPPWELHLAGDGPERGRVEDLCGKSRFEDRVVFAGEVEGMHRFLSKVDILVLSSRSESFPLSLLEGMRAGLPVVATRVGGIPEMVEEGVTGQLVPAGDAEAMAGVLAELIRNADKRKQMGERGHQCFLERYTQEKMIAATMASWKNLRKGETT